MKVRCKACGSQFQVTDAKIGSGGSIRCIRCNASFLATEAPGRNPKSSEKHTGGEAKQAQPTREAGAETVRDGSTPKQGSRDPSKPGADTSGLSSPDLDALLSGDLARDLHSLLEMENDRPREDTGTSVEKSTEAGTTVETPAEPVETTDGPQGGPEPSEPPPSDYPAGPSPWVMESDSDPAPPTVEPSAAEEPEYETVSSNAQPDWGSPQGPTVDPAGGWESAAIETDGTAALEPEHSLEKVGDPEVGVELDLDALDAAEETEDVGPDSGGDPESGDLHGTAFPTPEEAGLPPAPSLPEHDIGATDLDNFDGALESAAPVQDLGDFESSPPLSFGEAYEDSPEPAVHTDGSDAQLETDTSEMAELASPAPNVGELAVDSSATGSPRPAEAAGSSIIGRVALQPRKAQPDGMTTEPPGSPTRSSSRPILSAIANILFSMAVLAAILVTVVVVRTGGPIDGNVFTRERLSRAFGLTEPTPGAVANPRGAGIYVTHLGDRLIFVHGEIHNSSDQDMRLDDLLVTAILRDDAGAILLEAPAIVGDLPTAEDLWRISGPPDIDSLHARFARESPEAVAAKELSPFFVVFDDIPTDPERLRVEAHPRSKRTEAGEARSVD